MSLWVSKPGSSLLWQVALPSSKTEEGKGQKTQKIKKWKMQRKKPIFD
jgi:hypothetical protein